VKGLAGQDSLYGGTGDDTLLGGDGQDRLWGGAGRDSLDGGAGDDTLEGNAAADIIHGGAGDDYLAGGDAVDLLYGDAGADGFVFRSADRGGDIVADFSAAEGDFLVYDGGAVTRANFQVEIRAVQGVGNEAIRDVLIHFGAGGPVLWTLQDAGDLTSLKLLDANSGALLTLI
jgi:Ca2+-binding RTX toxin-like protein